MGAHSGAKLGTGKSGQFFETHGARFPSSTLRRINVKQIKVYIERNNPKNYYVDLSFLPKMAE